MDFSRFTHYQLRVFCGLIFSRIFSFVRDGLYYCYVEPKPSKNATWNGLVCGWEQNNISQVHFLHFTYLIRIAYFDIALYYLKCSFKRHDINFKCLMKAFQNRFSLVLPFKVGFLAYLRFSYILPQTKFYSCFLDLWESISICPYPNMIFMLVPDDRCMLNVKKNVFNILLLTKNYKINSCWIKLNALSENKKSHRFLRNLIKANKSMVIKIETSHHF